MKPARALLATVLVIAVLAAAGLAYVRRPHLPAAERGRRIAAANGCFACHGAEGMRGTANPGRVDGSVPTFEGDLMMFAKNADDVREWIHDGVPAKRAVSRSWQAARDAGALRMPAFGERLSDREIDDLVAFVLAIQSETVPDDSLARRGLERAQEIGCFGCHGPGGRLSRPNPGSLKGYIPSWDGVDFDELVHTRAEFDEWVERGVTRRFEANPIARFFLERAVLHMPPYTDHLEPGDLDAMWAYVVWLRSEESDGA